MVLPPISPLLDHDPADPAVFHPANLLDGAFKSNGRIVCGLHANRIRL